MDALTPEELGAIADYLRGYLNGVALVGFDRLQVAELIGRINDQLQEQH